MIDFLLMFGIVSFYIYFVVLFTKAWISCVRWLQVKYDLDFISLYMITIVQTFILFVGSFMYWVEIVKHTKFIF